MSNSIIGRVFLWVNYQTGIIYYDGNGDNKSLLQPEWPLCRRWKRCLGEIAIFHFDQQLSNKEVVQKVRKAGFVMGDIWCLISVLKGLKDLQVSQDFIPNPVCLVAPARPIHDHWKGRVSPFVNVISEKVLVDFVRRGSDWEGYWLPRWKFLAVRWLGVTIDDFWTSKYQPESVIIGPDGLTFHDGY